MILLSFLAVLTLQQSDGGKQSGLLDARAVIRDLTTHDLAGNMDALLKVFADDVTAYYERRNSLSATESARAWLALLDEAYKVPPPKQPMFGTPPRPIAALDTVVGFLPGPEVWPSIESLVGKEPPSHDKLVLQLLFARLDGDNATVLQLCKQLSTAPPLNPNQMSVVEPWDEPRFQAFGRLGDVESQVKVIDEETARPMGFNEDRFPNLVALWGYDRAKAALEFPILHQQQGLFIDGSPMQDAAQEVALEHLDEIKKPMWLLGDSYKDAPYVEKLVQHYGLDTLIANGGDLVYFHDLLAREDIDKAADYLNKVQYVPRFEDAGESLDSPDDVRGFYSTLTKLQARTDRDIWRLVVSAALADGQAKDLIGRIRTVLADPKTESALQRELLGYLVWLDGSLGDVGAVKRDYDAEIAIPWHQGMDDQASQNLLQFGLAIGDQDTIRKGVEYELREPYTGTQDSVQNALLGLGDFGKAEAVSEAEVTRDYGNQPQYDPWIGTHLCRLYYRANRPQDITHLLDEGPFWDSNDLAGCLAGQYQQYYHLIGDRAPLGYYAAWAFSQVGKKDLAIRILERLLPEAPSCDEAYELLNKLESARALPLYDKLSRAAPLEPRPYIWKGAILLDQGKVAEAEKLVRYAIALDPSDEEADRADEFKAYEVLGRILKRKGDETGAAACADRLEAGRLAGQASDLADAGLLPQAAAEFKASLAKFPNDFEVEQGLADCLDRMGDAKGAAEHYRRTYEVMPEDCGPGTVLPRPNDALFYGSLLRFAQPAMDEMAKSESSSPAAAFVRGMLNENLYRPVEAVKDFRQAVRSDPKFYSAWNQLAVLGHKGFLSPGDTEAAIYEQIGLDPACLNDQSLEYELFGSLGNLGVAYSKIETAEGNLFQPSSEPLYPLHGGAQAPAEERLNLYGSKPLFALPPGHFLARTPDLESIEAEYGPGNTR